MSRQLFEKQSAETFRKTKISGLELKKLKRQIV